MGAREFALTLAGGMLICAAISASVFGLLWLIFVVLP